MIGLDGGTPGERRRHAIAAHAVEAAALAKVPNARQIAPRNDCVDGRRASRRANGFGRERCTACRGAASAHTSVTLRSLW